jgi:hypothetical protein
MSAHSEDNLLTTNYYENSRAFKNYFKTRFVKPTSSLKLFSSKTQGPFPN